ncbi:hypothetical protein SNOUR_01140 [Streptomyces noursei ATCC 11455]|nr:hypothetical protein SNOUR_01140 [Streptomyces noursei ATCC 11455]
MLDVPHELFELLPVLRRLIKTKGCTPDQLVADPAFLLVAGDRVRGDEHPLGVAFGVGRQVIIIPSQCTDLRHTCIYVTIIGMRSSMASTQRLSMARKPP